MRLTSFLRHRGCSAKLDREPYSASYGSFDREHWNWKFRDFPITMFQAALYPMALLWRYPFQDNPYFQNPRLREWIEAGIESTLRRQHLNGSFDSVGPNTQDHGVSLAMVYILTETLRILGDDQRPELLATVKDAVRRGCQFSLQSSEDYAFISNHHALFALALLNASELLTETIYRQRAAETVDLILQMQSSDGWYREYGGPDPGYESLGIFYLAIYWQRSRSARVLESLQRSIEFYAHCVHPDGSVGGIYGSRHTQLYFPGGFEILAGAIPMAAAIAHFMREKLNALNVLTPPKSDTENLPMLVSSYLVACLTADACQATRLPLPCEALDAIRHFPDAAISVVGTGYYYAILNAAKGGVCRIFDKQTRRIVYEDAGYLIRAGGRAWTSQFLGLGHRVTNAQSKEIACEAFLSEVRQELLTPVKFVLLRILNLTLFRSLRLGSWLRRLIIGRLILARRMGPLRLTRTVTFEPTEVHFFDCVALTQPIDVEAIGLPRSFTAIHMGSAKYFHSSELEPTLQAPVKQMMAGLRRDGKATNEFTLRFASASGPQLIAGSTTEQTESPLR